MLILVLLFSDPLERPTATDLLAHEFLSTDPSFKFKDYVARGKI